MHVLLFFLYQKIIKSKITNVPMLLKIPFYKNNKAGTRCMQVSMKSVLKYFLNKNYSLKTLDYLTGRSKKYWTTTHQGVAALHDLGLQVLYHAKTPPKLFLEGEAFIKRHFKKDADQILKHLYLPTALRATRKLLRHDLYRRKKLSLAEIERHFKRGHASIVLIDNNKILRKKGPYRGHFVVITAFDKNHVYYHDSGPTRPMPNKKVSKKMFTKALNAPAADRSVIVVTGKRKR